LLIAQLLTCLILELDKLLAPGLTLEFSVYMGGQVSTCFVCAVPDERLLISLTVICCFSCLPRQWAHNPFMHLLLVHCVL
jgi:hypothetical protein